LAYFVSDMTHIMCEVGRETLLNQFASDRLYAKLLVTVHYLGL